ncbi:hypothetical protein B0H14DRAFT_3009589, partial [Mycena olivaceomarginata]
MTPLKRKLAVVPFLLYLTGLGVAAAAAVAALEPGPNPQDMCTFAGLGNRSFATCHAYCATCCAAFGMTGVCEFGQSECVVDCQEV